MAGIEPPNDQTRDQEKRRQPKRTAAVAPAKSEVPPGKQNRCPQEAEDDAHKQVLAKFRGAVAITRLLTRLVFIKPCLTSDVRIKNFEIDRSATVSGAFDEQRFVTAGPTSAPGGQ